MIATGRVALTLLIASLKGEQPINIQSVVTGKDDASIIAEAERGEDSAKQAYEDALQAPLFTQTLALVREQSMKVHDAHDRVRALDKVAR